MPTLVGSIEVRVETLGLLSAPEVEKGVAPSQAVLKTGMEQVSGELLHGIAAFLGG